MLLLALRVKGFSVLADLEKHTAPASPAGQFLTIHCDYERAEVGKLLHFKKSHNFILTATSI